MSKLVTRKQLWDEVTAKGFGWGNIYVHRVEVGLDLEAVQTRVLMQGSDTHNALLRKIWDDTDGLRSS